MNTIVTANSYKNFYPTPKALAEKMLEYIDLSKDYIFLEPDAGKGDLIKVLAEKINKGQEYNGRYYSLSANKYSVDCIEIDPNLSAILKYNFSDEYSKTFKRKIYDLEEKQKCFEWYTDNPEKYPPLTKEESKELSTLKIQSENFIPNVKHIYDDFLTFNSHKKYDVILMNPPFSEGDKHLLKAIQIQSLGGKIICLLNAETLRNPYSNIRKVLCQQLEKYNAEITFLSGEFETDETERKTNVDVVLVYINIPCSERKSFIFEQLEKAKEEKESFYNDVTELSTQDFLSAAVDQYNMEVEGVLHLIDEFEAIIPYMKRSLNESSYNADTPMLSLCFYDDDRNYKSIVDKNEYLRKVRLKYWSYLMSNQKFVGKMTSNLQEKYQSMTEKMKDYDFNLFNIKMIQKEIVKDLVPGVEETILKVFNKLSGDHSWYPETQNNIHYYNGWCANSAHKINKKVILPMNGYASSWSKDNLDVYKIYDNLGDIEKCFDYLDMGETNDEYYRNPETGEEHLINMQEKIRRAEENNQTGKIQLKYFQVTFYKKGTCHIVFTNQDVLDKLNIFGSQRKGWLPPVYGRKKYTDMTVEEQTVINEFQGEKAYNSVFQNPQRYIYTSENSLKMLSAGVNIKSA